MATQRTKSIADIKAQLDRIRSSSPSAERLAKANNAGYRYIDNIFRKSSRVREYNRQIRGSNPFNGEMAGIRNKRDSLKFSRRTYMGGMGNSNG